MMIIAFKKKQPMKTMMIYKNYFRGQNEDFFARSRKSSGLGGGVLSVRRTIQSR